ncbi:hypothetical protein [Comamonas aquatica]|uniref:hypothetical protein n=1 Tax=Comamonas aquatica TaxID=225991 RepID=UPI0004AD436B|nr:hypothetical protein [Comamonas aquatica]
MNPKRNNIFPFKADEIEKITASFEKLPSQKTSYANGGGGGYDDGMDTRITKLENFAEDAKQRLARVETKLDHIDKEVSSFKWWLFGAVLTVVLTVIGTVVGTGVGIQQMTVSTFQAAGAQAQTASPTPQPTPIVIQIPALPAAPPVQQPVEAPHTISN